MNRIKTILISLAAITAVGTPATRADEMSDLVAAVAASMEAQERMQADVMSPLRRGKLPLSTTSVTPSFLDGILKTMEGRASALPARNFSEGRASALPARKKEETMASRYYSFGIDSPLVTERRHGESGSSPVHFFRPVPGPVTSRFGWRPAFHRVHHGVDLALQIGDTVRCAVSGTVSLISYDHDGYGHYVLLTNQDGMETLYGHLQYPLVAQGQYIYAGMPIGIGGNTGNSTGPHLHFEARLGGVAVDPLILFDFYGINQYLYATESPAETAPKTPTYSHQQKSLKQEATYIVRAGDTAESVARQAGISVMRLRQLNMLSDGAPLPLGRMLKLR